MEATISYLTKQAKPGSIKEHVELSAFLLSQHLEHKKNGHNGQATMYARMNNIVCDYVQALYATYNGARV